MATPDEAYGKGYEKGRKEGLAGNTAEAIFGMMKDDPGGHHAAGYRDGAAGKNFNPPSAQAPVRKPAADVNPFDDKVAIKAVCPHCGALDWFEWKFLGRLTDPICGQSWYAGSGTYTAMQIRAAFAAGGKGAKYFTSGVSGGEGAWIARALGWFMGVLLGLAIRLEFGVLMIPIQALAGLFQAKKTSSDVAIRIVVLAVTLVGLGILVHEVQEASRRQLQPSQPVQNIQTPSPQNASTTNPAVGTVPLVRPSEPSSGSSFTDTFNNAANCGTNWVYTVVKGNPIVSCLPGDLHIDSPRSGSLGRLLSNQSFTGDVDATFSFRHRGSGQTQVGLFNRAGNEYVAGIYVDTDDVPYLGFQGLPGQQYPNPPYLNQNVLVRIRTAGNQVQFFVNGTLFRTEPMTLPPSYQLLFQVGSETWKTDDNHSDLYSVVARF